MIDKYAKQVNAFVMEIKIHCKYDELVDPKKLKNHPKNPNKHANDQIERLSDLYKYHGIRHAIIISNLSGKIVAGHGRKMAALRIGIKEFPVVYQDFESEESEYAFMTSDNAIQEWSELDYGLINLEIQNLGPDFDLKNLGLKNFELEPADKEGLTESDNVPDVAQNVHNVQLGQIWKLGEHRLMCGDSTNAETVAKLMDGNKADMVFTDPPYGIDEETDRAFAARSRIAKGNTFSKIIGDDSIETALKILSIIEDIKIHVLWGANYYCHSLPQTNNWLVWDKREEEKERDMNSDCELAFVKCKKSSTRIFRHKWKGMIKASEHGQSRVHPTQKPIALAEWCFNEYAKDSKSILDLFGGSGSTLIACEKTNRKCFMMELDPHYCSVIIERWQQFTGQKAELITT